MKSKISKFDGFVTSIEMIELIITYDISNEFDPFYSKFKSWLDRQSPIKLTESTYKLNGTFNRSQIEIFESEISEIFEESQNILESQSFKSYNAVIIFIMPENNQLLNKIIINKINNK